MLARSTKPNRCKFCKVRMPEDKARHVIHDECIAPWLDKEADKKALARKKAEAAKAKVERAEYRRRKEAIKTLAQLKAETQKAVNAYCRALDVGKPCISCGKPWQDTFQAGHYRTRGAAPHLALELGNMAGQCTQCNLHLHGNQAAMRQGLVARNGEAAVLALEADDTPRKWTRDQLISLRVMYQRKTKLLKENT